MAPHAAITSHSYIVGTDGDESRCCSDEDGSHPPPSWERWCSACVASALPASYTSSHTCIIFECFWYLRWILLSYKCDLALIICVWMGDVSTAVLYVCVCTPYPSTWTDRPLLGWRSPRSNTSWIWCSASEMLEGLEVSVFLSCCSPCPNIPAALINYTRTVWEKSWKWS